MINKRRAIAAVALAGSFSLSMAGTSVAAPTDTQKVCTEQQFDGTNAKKTWGQLCLNEDAHDMWITLEAQCKPGLLDSWRGCTRQSAYYTLKKDGNLIGYFSLSDRLQYPGPGNYEVTANVTLDGSWSDGGAEYGVSTNGTMDVNASFETPVDTERLRANISDPTATAGKTEYDPPMASYTLTVTNGYKETKNAGLRVFGASYIHSNFKFTPASACLFADEDAICNLGSLAPGESKSISVTVPLIACPPFQWEASLTDGGFRKDADAPTPQCPTG